MQRWRSLRCPPSAAVSVSAQSDSAIRGQVVAAADGSVLARIAVTLTSLPTGEAVQQPHRSDRVVCHFQASGPASTVLSVSSDGFGARELRFVLEPREVRTVTVSLEVAPRRRQRGGLRRSRIDSRHALAELDDADDRAAGGDAGVSANHAVRCDRHARRRA